MSDYLSELRERSLGSKESRVLFNKIIAYIDLLKEKGTYIGEPYVKHLDGEIWELRPLSIRILFAYFNGRTVVLLHHFVKTTKTTPRREITKAKRELKDYQRRHG